MDEIAPPVTRAKVEALTAKWADDPSTTVEVVHQGFNDDEHCGGFAFQCDRGLLICGFDGSSRWSHYPGDDESRRDEVVEYWNQSRYRNPAARQFRDDEPGYRAWLKDHPNGYVINILRNHNPTDARLHRADCRTLTDQLSRGVALVGPYVKVCSDHLDALDEWAADQVRVLIQRCGSCRPEPNAVHLLPTKPALPVKPQARDGRWDIYGPTTNSPVVEAWADDYIRFERRPAWQERLRDEIRSRCRRLSPADREVLHATYFGDKRPKADIENLVLYNIDSFSVAGRNGIRLEYGGLDAPPAPDGAEYRFGYRYTLARSDNFIYWNRVRTLASFDWTDLEGTTLAPIWLALARRRVRREADTAEHVLAPEVPFALRVRLRAPYGHGTYMKAELMKAVLDGVICAFQAHTDTKDLADVVAWLAEFLQVAPEEVEWLLRDQGAAVIGPVPRLVYPRMGGVQWNPSDDRCFAGELFPVEPEPDDTCWAIKGEIFEISAGTADTQ
ncbi:hypothetical protein [Mycolicibacter algericus]|uniref:hypothetical protein n=1 Tax=Mycolicibacter algericus TaxID=1288388 RepID=UPI003C770861